MQPPAAAANTALFALVLAVATPNGSEGQNRDSPSGHRVRVVTDSVRGSQFVGRVIYWDDESLRMAIRGEPVTIPIAEISRMEISRGRGREFLKYTAIGLVAGAAAGALAGALYDDVNPQPDCSRNDCVGPTALLLGYAGGFVGALIGLTAGVIHESWEPYSVDRLSLSVGGPAGVGIGFSLALGPRPQP